MLDPKMKGRLGALQDVEEMMDESEVDALRPKPAIEEPEAPAVDGLESLSPEDIEKLKAMLSAME